MNLQGKNVLVTGGAGYVGSSLVRKLVEEKSEVVVLDNFSYGHMENLSDIKNQIHIVKGDIRNSGLIKNVIKKNNIEFIFHLVADPFVPNSYKNPGLVFDVITKGTQNIIMANPEQIKKILFLSTAEIYGYYKYLPMDENHPCNPVSVYATAKLAADRLCFIMHNDNDIPVNTLRLFNTFGPRETHPYIIPELILQFSKSSVAKLGNLKSRRSLIYVDDAVTGMMKLMKSRISDEVFNLGSNKSYSIEELARIVADSYGHNKIQLVVEKHRKRALDPPVFQCDFSKIKKAIDWKPKISLEQGIEKTMDWFEQNNRSWIWEKTYGFI